MDKKMKKTAMLILALIAVCVVSAAAADTFGENSLAAKTYRHFISSLNYDSYIHYHGSRFADAAEQELRTRDREWDRFCLHDMNGDGTPELLVYSYGKYEQADIFTYDGNVRFLGTIDDDNFIQFLVYYEDARYPGLFAFFGGPANTVFQYTLKRGILKISEFGMTKLNSQEEAVGFYSPVSDSRLSGMLLNTANQNRQNAARNLDWCRYNELMAEGSWTVFFRSATGMK